MTLDPSGDLRVRDLSEEELLARVFPELPLGGATQVPPGDDAAVVAAPDGRFVVTTDVLVEDRHFRRRWSTGRDVGRRAAVQNLADVAAMGARPTSVVVALVVPGDVPVTWVVDLARGLGDVCAPQGAGVVGGDLSSGPVLVVSVAAHGDLEGRAPVLRSGARPGDILAHAGARGRSAAGLALLEAGRVSSRGDGQASDADLVAAYLSPAAPLDAGPRAAAAGATAMIDVSDGLLRDAERLARASGVALDLDVPATAFGADLDRLAAAAASLGMSAEGWVLAGGEDHGLLATFPAGAELPAPFRPVGRVRVAGDDTGRPGTVLVGGRRWDGATGWDHFDR